MPATKRCLLSLAGALSLLALLVYSVGCGVQVALQLKEMAAELKTESANFQVSGILKAGRHRER